MSRVDRSASTADAPVRNAMSILEETARGIVLILDDAGRLVGTITDGDIRRGILHGVGLDDPIQALLDVRAHVPRGGAQRSMQGPVIAPIDTGHEDLLHLMTTFKVEQVPLVDPDGKVQDIVFLDDLVEERDIPVDAVVMAGGFGKRLGGLTKDTPKPMLPVGDKPLLERIIEQLRDSGIGHVNLTTHYKADVIKRHIGDGARFGIDVSYVDEEEPLGTAGALSLVGDQDGPMFVINGDILTSLDFRAMYRFHEEHAADLTIAVRQHDIHIPYGVLDMEDVSVKGLAEKPSLRHFVNAGIYLLAPSVFSYIPDDTHYEMTDLVAQLVKDGRRVIGFPVREYWRDIGHVRDYESADRDVREGKV